MRRLQIVMLTMLTWLLACAGAQAVSSFDNFSYDPNIATEWTTYVYYDFKPSAAAPVWNSVDEGLDLPARTAFYRTITTRLPTDPVTVTVKTLSRGGNWGFLGLMISAVPQPEYITTADDTYTLQMAALSATNFQFNVTRTYLDGTTDYVLYAGPSQTFAGPYVLEIERDGDDYLFKVDGATLYTTASPASGDFYDTAAKDSMVYYQIVLNGDGGMTATVDDFGVSLGSDVAVILDGNPIAGSIASNAPVGTVVGQLSMINTNPAGFAYSLDAGGDTTHFDIPVGTSKLVTKAALGAGPYALKIVGANGGFAVVNDFTILVAAPITIGLSNTNMTSIATVGTEVGVLSMLNASSQDGFTYELEPAGDTTHFAISNTNRLITAAPLDVGSYDIVIKGTNSTDNFWVTNAFTIVAIAEEPLPEPVQYWTFDDASGTTAANLATNGNSGTLVNSPTWITTGLAPKLTSRDDFPSKAALDLDGGSTADYVDGGNIDLTSTSGGGEVTVSMWLNPDSLDSGTRLFTQSTPGGATSQQGTTDVLDDGGIAVWNASGSGYVYPAPAGSVTTGVWQHIAFVWDSGQVTAYVDGAKKSTVPVNFDFGAANGNFGIAADLVGQYGAGIDGKIDEIAIFDVALNLGQIASLANGAAAIAAPPPAGMLFIVR
jgi:hypothetical protein